MSNVHTSNSLPAAKPTVDRRHLFKQRMSTSKLLCITYVLMGVLSLFLGVLRNGGSRKYVPANAEKFEGKCKKVYVNVHSKSPENGVICCTETMPHPNMWSWTTSSYEHELCYSRASKLPLSRAILSFPEAWIIPIIPVIIYFIFELWAVNINSTLYRGTPQEAFQKAFFRILFYISIMCFRGFILYLFLDLLEDIFAEWKSFGKDLTSCWFSDLTRPSSKQNICSKQQFDFSDHIVFFFGHLLPLILFESIIWINSPLRGERIFFGVTKMVHWFVTTCTFVFFAYLGLLSYISVYRTAAFFHTKSEIISGYISSLVVQIPLGMLYFTNYWSSISSQLGLPNFPIRED